MSENNPINGVQVGELLEFKNICAQHPEKPNAIPHSPRIGRAGRARGSSSKA